MRWTTADIPDQTGRTAVVTGATSGLGLETVRALAAAGARVVLATRDAARTERVLADLRREQPTALLDHVGLDLADLASVRRAADELTHRDGGIDVLVNNAGVMFPPRVETADGFESQLGTNHLGHFALTGLLLPALLRSPGPRVVTVASTAHRAGRIRRDDLQWTAEYDRGAAYAQSKLANLLFAAELDRRSRLAGIDLVSTAAHPGWSATQLQSAGISTDAGAGARLVRGLMQVGNRLVAMPAARGALPQLYAATAPGVAGGTYWGPDGLLEMRGDVGPARRTPAARDAETARWLWERSSELTGVSYEFPAGSAA